MGEAGVKAAGGLTLALALALGLAACSAPSYPTIAPPAEVAPAPRPPALAPRPPPPRSPVPRPRVRVEDSCGAAALQGLIGRPRSEIPVPIEPRRQRVACTTCPVTDDYIPTRLNFFFDADTGLIKRIRCG